MRSRKKGKLQLKFLIGLIAMTVVLMITLCLVITRQYRRSMESYYTKMAFDQAKIAAEYIDGDTIKDYTLTETVHIFLGTQSLTDWTEAASAT